MGRLIYLFNVSLDGYVETPDHSLAWARMDEELHAWFNDQMRGLDAEIYGRRLWELMSAYWPIAEDQPDVTDVEREYARLWTAMPRVVLSTTLTEVGWGARLVRGDVAEVLAALREEFPGDIGVGGPTTAAPFIERDLVDEYRLVVHPVVIGAGTPFFPPLDREIPLRLLERREFPSGVVYLRYEAIR